MCKIAYGFLIAENAESGSEMPYKIVLHNMYTETVETHYIHAENERVAKFKALKFQCGKKYRKIDYLRMTEIEVLEECGVYDD